MTVYEIQRSWGGDGEETTVPDIPERLVRVWEVDGGTEWQRRGQFWRPLLDDGFPASEWEWGPMLTEFGPVTDEAPVPWRCPRCGGESGCAGHTRTAETVLAPVGGVS